ncbi:tetracycline resistance [Fusarium circinatum]|uniref:Tetracycline resistance n=1 Tax=Fusarium circinatum TaxID=48490 RepID=A0A8H5X3Z1_FUSCI|nr:tetracycline resistance [Fusarium circinatum]
MAESSLGTSPTQDLQSTPTTGETSPTFELFSRLPTELRLKIWESACLLYSSRIEGGLHYVTVDAVDTEDTWKADYIHPVHDNPNLEGSIFDYEGDGYVALRALEYPCDKTGNSLSLVKPPNKSAYLWDAGLWLACTESREVVSKHSYSKEWLACREQPLQSDERPWYRKDFPSAIVPQNKSEKWCPLVKPNCDMFCIDTSNLEAIPQYPYMDMMLLVPFFGTKKFTVIGNWNIAFKFDRSWNENFPFNWSDLMEREDSIRSRLANSLSHEQVAVDPVPSLWIIDDTVHWIAQSHQTYRAAWRDLEDEYVAIDWDETRSNMVDRTQGAVTYFLNALQHLADNDDYFYHSPPFSLSIGLLVRRGNQLPGFIEEDVQSDNEDGEDSDNGSDDENDWANTSGEEEE